MLRLQWVTASGPLIPSETIDQSLPPWWAQDGQGRRLQGEGWIYLVASCGVASGLGELRLEWIFVLKIWGYSIWIIGTPWFKILFHDILHNHKFISEFICHCMKCSLLIHDYEIMYEFMLLDLDVISWTAWIHIRFHDYEEYHEIICQNLYLWIHPCIHAVQAMIMKSSYYEFIHEFSTMKDIVKLWLNSCKRIHIWNHGWILSIQINLELASDLFQWGEFLLIQSNDDLDLFFAGSSLWSLRLLHCCCWVATGYCCCDSRCWFCAQQCGEDMKGCLNSWHHWHQDLSGLMSAMKEMLENLEV